MIDETSQQPNPQDCAAADWSSELTADSLLNRQRISMCCPRFPYGSPISTYSVRVREQRILELDEVRSGYGVGSIAATICLGCEFFEPSQT